MRAKITVPVKGCILGKCRVECEENCQACGWNEKVAAARVAAIWRGRLRKNEKGCQYLSLRYGGVINEL